MEIIRLAALSDNYVWLLRDGVSGRTAVIDPAEAEPVRAALTARGWRLDEVWNTHHHYDHTGGNVALVEQFDDIVVRAPSGDGRRFPCVTDPVGDKVALGGVLAEVIRIPGHTRDHVAFYFEAEKRLFCGDTLFSVGCGRVFDGTHRDLYRSLMKLRELPDDVWVHCGHEYTQANCRFARHVESENTDLTAFARRIDGQRARGEATVPSLMGDEKRVNPFLRARDFATFRRLRDAKDRF